MRRRKRSGGLAVAFSVALAAVAVAAAFFSEANVSHPVEAAPAFNAGWKKGRETGMPVPRFVSLKTGNARMRIGPSIDYGTHWIYRAKGIPLEITEEYGNWRQVRDHDGISGWMYAPLLSGHRTAVVGPWISTATPLYGAASSRAKVLADLQAKVRMAIDRCDGNWCKVSLHGHDISGYVEQASLWGVYPGEKIE